MKNKKILAWLFVFWVFGCFSLLENNDPYINQYAKDKRNTLPLHLSNNFLTREWNYTWGGAGNEVAYGVAIDSLDNIYVTGYTESFGALNEDKFLLKYNSTGALQWNYTRGGVGDDPAFGLAIDSSDNIYVTGRTESFGALSEDAFLLKYNSTGALQWNYTWGGAGDELASGVAIDSLDNIYITGYTESFGALSEDVILLKYNSTGALQWNYTWGGVGDDSAFGLAIDSSDNIYITGRTRSFGALDEDIFLLKYNTMGVLQWNYTWGGAGREQAYGITVDSSDNIYITGGTENFGMWDIFIFKYNTMGVLQWNYTWDGARGELAVGVAIDSSDNIYITGYTEGFGVWDIFLLKYNTKGVLQWNYTWGGAGNDSAYGIAVDSLGNIYITGWTLSFGALGLDIFIVKFNNSTPLPAKEVPLFIILISVLSTVAGIGLTVIAIALLRKRKQAIPEESIS